MLSMLWVFVLPVSSQQQIDPKIYAKIFEVNRPAWNRLAQLVEAKVPVGSKVLDVGAGPGRISRVLVRSCRSI